MAQKSSKTFSFIGENIKKIRMAKNISQADFAKIFSLARPSVGAYEEGRSEPKIETIIQIANYFRLSIDTLLRRELSVSEIYSLGTVNQKLNRAHRIENPVTATFPGVPFVSIEQHIDYIVRRGSTDFIQGLPKLFLPQNESGLRAFGLKGNQMEYQQHGLHHGDIIFGKPTEEKAYEKLQNHLAIVVSRESIDLGRASFAHGAILVKYDNPHYPSKELPLDSILEIWFAKGAISQYLAEPSMLEERVGKLESALAQLKSQGLTGQAD